jgi:hypothetical protein
MTVRLYKSTDASAPSLTGQTGSLVALLDACLVNGYGSKPAAGWTKAYSAANKAAYQQNATGANNAAAPMLLYVDDTGPGAGSSREARCCGFETMSAITPTGTGQFPTAAQSAIGVGTVVVRKSNTADATVRQWTVIANGQTVYLFIETGDLTAPLGCATFVFGDFKSYKAVDPYAVFIMGRVFENGGTLGRYDPMQVVSHITSSSMHFNRRYMGHYVARSWTGLGGSTQVGKTFDLAKMGVGLAYQYQSDSETSVVPNGGVAATMGRNANSAIPFPAPNGPDGAIWLSPVYLFHNYNIRGYLPGLWAPVQDRPLTHNDTLTIASGNLSGKSLICQQFMAWIGLALGDSDCGQVCVEYSDTWT